MQKQTYAIIQYGFSCLSPSRPMLTLKFDIRQAKLVEVSCIIGNMSLINSDAVSSVFRSLPHSCNVRFRHVLVFSQSAFSACARTCAQAMAKGVPKWPVVFEGCHWEGLSEGLRGGLPPRFRFVVQEYQG